MSKEIWKLIELLNEYETPRSWIVYKSYDDYDWFFYWVDCDWETEIAWSDSLICSKKFWWIWWLVENEKLWDNKNSDRYTMMKLMRAEINEWTGVFEWTKRYEFVIMILSIQDEPIEFLISILK